jgi:hypothetical protein
LPNTRKSIQVSENQDQKLQFIEKVFGFNKLSGITCVIFIIELVSLQFKHRFITGVTNRAITGIKEERRREIEAKSDQFEEEEDQTPIYFRFRSLPKGSEARKDPLVQISK